MLLPGANLPFRRRFISPCSTHHWAALAVSGSAMSAKAGAAARGAAAGGRCYRGHNTGIGIRGLAYLQGKCFVGVSLDAVSEAAKALKGRKVNTMASVKRALTRRVRLVNRYFLGCDFLLWGVLLQGVFLGGGGEGIQSAHHRPVVWGKLVFPVGFDAGAIGKSGFQPEAAAVQHVGVVAGEARPAAHAVLLQNGPGLLQKLRPGLLLIHFFVVQLQLHPGALGGAGEAGAGDGLDVAAPLPELQRFQLGQRRGGSRRLRGRWGGAAAQQRRPHRQPQQHQREGAHGSFPPFCAHGSVSFLGRGGQNGHSAVHHRVQHLVLPEVFHQNILTGGGHAAGLLQLAEGVVGDVEKALDVFEVVVLQAHGEQGIVADLLAHLLAAVGKVIKVALGAVVAQPQGGGQLVELGVAGVGLLPQHIVEHFPQLPPRHLEHIHPIVVGETLDEVAVGDDGAKLLGPDAAGADEHHVDAKAAGEDIRKQVAKLSLLGALRVGQLPAEPPHDVAVLFVHLAGEALQHLLHGRVAGAGLGADGHGAPCVGIDAVVVGVHHDVKAPDLVGAGARLRDDHAVFLHRVLRQGVAVPADDQVHSPRRVQLARQMFVLLKADVGQQHGKVDVDAVVGVADLAHLGGSGGGVHKGAYQRFGFGLVDDILRDNADEQDVHAVHPQDLVGGKQPGGGVFDVEVGVDDGKARAFFDEQQVGDAVIHLVVADGDHVRGKGVHDLDGGKPLVL